MIKFIFRLIDYLKIQSEAHSRRRRVEELIKLNLLKVGVGTYQYELLEIDVYKGSESKVEIGNYCSIAKNVRIITGGIHPVGFISTYPFRIKFQMESAYQDGMPYSKGDVIIGNDVWIGSGVTILSGVKIGDGAVLAANSLISRDVPNYAVVAGNPAVILKYRFNEQQIEELIKLQWWNWPESEILRNVSFLSSRELDKFILSNK